MEEKNLIDVIHAVKPTAALFTTYTLSLSFFEAMILPVLKQHGCEHIIILVDAREAARSLEEAHIRYAGSLYWLVPVIAPGGGVFHPKLTYLNGDAQDVLTVGSGNLTFSGQSAQLETLDVVSSLSAPALFHQFSDFSQALAESLQKTSSRAAVILQSYAIRARKMAANNSDQKSAVMQLIHTLHQPASQQIATLWPQDMGRPQRLTVLSPFHTPGLGPVTRLADTLGIANIAIGLDPVSLEAPFKATCQFDTVVPQTAHPRRLHGKVIEIFGASCCVTISGSINATRQSFETQKNVEVSLARIQDVPCFEWAYQEPQNYEVIQTAFEPADDMLLFVHAERLGTALSGQVGSAQHGSNMASVYLLRQDHEILSEPLPVMLSAEGKFSCTLPSQYDYEGAVTLRLVFGERTAVCWINDINELSLSMQQRDERRSIHKIISGNFNENDIRALLGILHRFALPPGEAVRPEGQPIDDRSRDQEGDFSYSQWVASERTPREMPMSSLRHASILALVKWLTGSGRAQVSNRMERDYFDFVEENAADSHIIIRQHQETLLALLQKLLDYIPSFIENYPQSDSAAFLVMVSAASALRVAVREGEAATYWLDKFSRLPYSDAVRNELKPMALGMALTALNKIDRSNQNDTTASRLKVSLLRFDLTATQCDAAAQQHALRHVLFTCDTVRDNAATLSERIWQSVSLEEQLLTLAISVRNGCYDESVIFPGIVSSLRHTLPLKPQAIISSALWSQGSKGCPHCYYPLLSATRIQLQNRHAVRCDSDICHKVIFFIEQEDILARMREVLTNV
ncbi:hypothetical protein [Pantoea agglomerans]|uniref:Uncharacterized protein n=1 Tax=Enterobacter agglomerans TaxID=549 RepID=A0ACC5RL31_ENTAG|nr:hypothetical protein [Pantoea agglomerans]MBK4725303.1 hypothetical protein [Pantoea agglomerans]